MISEAKITKRRLERKVTYIFPCRKEKKVDKQTYNCYMVFGVLEAWEKTEICENCKKLYTRA